MAKKVIIDTEYVSLCFYPESGIVHHTIHQYLPEGVMEELLTTGAEYLEKHNGTKWLSDDRGNTVVRPADAEWGLGVWLPRVLLAGFKYWAVVMPAKAIGKMQMRTLITELAGRGVTVQAFDKLDPAMKWLESV